MDKKFDVTKKVMKQVVSFEKKRSLSRLFEIILSLVIILITSFAFLYFALNDIIEQKSLNLLSIFNEDPEIIRQYWKDNISIFWQELPQEKTMIGILFLLFAIILIILFRKKIRVIIRRLKSIRKF